MKEVKFCLKRDGNIEPFDKKVITNAIMNAFSKSNEGNRFLANKLTESIVVLLNRAFYDEIPHVEQIQDFVEDTLINYKFKNAAKEYIRYRHERNRERELIEV